MKNVFFVCAVLVALCAVCGAAPSANDGITYLVTVNGTTEEIDVKQLITAIESIECGPDRLNGYKNEVVVLQNGKEKSQFKFCNRILNESHKCPHLRGCAVMPKSMTYPTLRVTSEFEEGAYTHKHVFTDSNTNVHTLWKAEQDLVDGMKWGCVPISRTNVRDFLDHPKCQADVGKGHALAAFDETFLEVGGAFTAGPATLNAILAEEA
eukprot:Nk52_evm1s2587 gene=Nk52_evmTU1s2587